MKNKQKQLRRSKLKTTENIQLNLMHLLKKKNKVYYLISKRKYSKSLMQKELAKLKNYILVLIFKIWYIMLRVPLKIILDNFNNSIHAATLFDYINSQNIGFEDAEKMQMKFESKLSSERVGIINQTYS